MPDKSRVKKDANYYLALGKREFDKKRYSIAMDLINKALESDSENAEALKLKAESLLVQHQFDQVLECLEKALSANFDNKELLRLKARALYGLGRHEESLTFCEEALRLFPEDMELWYSKSMNLEALHREYIPAFEKTLQLCNKMLDANLSDVRTWCGKAATLYWLGKNQEAIECCEKVLETSPKHEGALAVKAAALLKTKLYNEAIKICDKLIRVNPRSTEAWNIKGTCLAEQGKYRVAIKCYSEALQLNPHDGASLSSKDQCLLALGVRVCPICNNEAMKLYSNNETGYICPNAKLMPLSKFAAIHACQGEKNRIGKSWFGTKCPNCGSSCQRFVTKDGLFVHLCPNTTTRTSDGKLLVPCKSYK